jgi:phospholipid transport system substrate-binding protein
MKFFRALPAFFALFFLFVAASANAQQEAPDALVKRISQEILDLAKTDQQIQAGNQQRTTGSIDQRIPVATYPHLLGRDHPDS